MSERSYLSIGDVLTLLQAEFPDVTISKIRFLESRGLLVPERTPSGYRKFYDHDVERLRWILRQQRENFLPLKVIKGRLEGQPAPTEPAALFAVGPALVDDPPPDATPHEAEVNAVADEALVATAERVPAAVAAAVSPTSNASVNAAVNAAGRVVDDRPVAAIAARSVAPLSASVTGPIVSRGSILVPPSAGHLTPAAAPLPTHDGSPAAAVVPPAAGAPPVPRPAAAQPVSSGTVVPRPSGVIPRPGRDAASNLSRPATPPLDSAPAAGTPIVGAPAAGTPIVGAPAAGTPGHNYSTPSSSASALATPATPAAKAALPDSPPASPGSIPMVGATPPSPPLRSTGAVRGLAASASDESPSHSEVAGIGTSPVTPSVSAPVPPSDTPAAPSVVSHGSPPRRAASLATEMAGATFTAAELAHATGLTEAAVDELVDFGLIESRQVAGVTCFDESAVVIAGLAGGYAKFGIEARHLRIFKHAAERQASLYSQIVMPLLRQRNPVAKKRAMDDLAKLTELGASLQECFVKAALRDLTGG